MTTKSRKKSQEEFKNLAGLVFGRHMVTACINEAQREKVELQSLINV